MDTPQAKQIFIVDHPIIQDGLENIFQFENDLKICGRANSSEETLKHLPSVKPDLMIADIFLKGIGGLDFVENIRRAGYTFPILVLSIYEGISYAEQCVGAGIEGYIPKKEKTSTLLKAIRNLLNGQIYIDEDLKLEIIKKFFMSDSLSVFSPKLILTEEEQKVYNFIGDGCPIETIAKLLNLNAKKIILFREQIKKKLYFKDNVELLQSAIGYRKG
ncbi:response regulator transcription factor [Candidatus Uabimicrobium amorphum]|uniref:DNA-binding response regulator n=1 Tax=Uabimicrobium amorphum TaxID=2596890 RepID=A0A5S9IJ75_UABAM|nr:response regulator transcription factor [Candidatus Uabimicrobium amorphum]BBM82879.1 DNA-binding response regulator [Candidatus Uabimicrobium amorphum]